MEKSLEKVVKKLWKIFRLEGPSDAIKTSMEENFYGGGFWKSYEKYQDWRAIAIP